MRQLLPEPADDLTVEQAYAAPLGSHPDRPWVGLCMVASIDGSVVFEGASAGLSNPTDAAVLGQLRRVADVVIVGAGTVRDEGYGAPQTAGQRIGVVTRSADVDLSGELFASGAGFLITTDDAPVRSPSVDVLRAGRDEVDLPTAIRRLDEFTDRCRFVQAEGGPALNGALLDGDLLDELNLTTSATTVGGSGPRLASGADQRREPYELRQLAIDEQSFLYARWLRRRR